MNIFAVLLLLSVSEAFAPLSTRIFHAKVDKIKAEPANTDQEPSSSSARSKEAIIDLKGLGQAGALASFVATSLNKPEQAHAALGDDEDVPPAEDMSKFVTTDSGLKYFDIKTGDGAVPVPGDTVQVHYTGWLDGFDGVKKFDSSYDRRQPLVFKAGVKQVISGWDEGLLTDLHVGGKRKLVIPPSLGYGVRGAGGVIPPNATLFFTIELVGIGAKRIR